MTFKEIIESMSFIELYDNLEHIKKIIKDYGELVNYTYSNLDSDIAERFKPYITDNCYEDFDLDLDKILYFKCIDETYIEDYGYELEVLEMSGGTMNMVVRYFYDELIYRYFRLIEPLNYSDKNSLEELMEDWNDYSIEEVQRKEKVVTQTIIYYE